MDTKLAPVSVAQYKEGNSIQIWRQDASLNNRYNKPCIEHEDDILQESHKLSGIKMQTLKPLNVQELDRLFHMEASTARKRSEEKAEAIRKARLETCVNNKGIYLAEFIRVQSKMINAVLKEIDKLFRMKTKPLSSSFYSGRSLYPTDNSIHYHKTLETDGGAKEKGKAHLQKVSIKLSRLVSNLLDKIYRR